VSRGNLSLILSSVFLERLLAGPFHVVNEADMQLLERYFEGSLVLEASVVIMALVALSVQNVFFYLVDLLSEVELSFPDLILQLSDSVFLDL
jgi:hypothetical protein